MGKIRRALGAVKDQTSIGLAKVGSSASLADLDVAIVKATRHVEQPAEEKHIREILSLTCYSRAFISACVNTLSKRLSKTRNWTVALKTLILVQRLLADGDPAYEQEIFFSTRRGTRFLNLSDFRDSSSGAGAWDYSAFVRTYALYLDERLEHQMQSRRGRRSAFGFEDDEEEAGAATAAAVAVVVRSSTPVREMRTDQVFSRAHHLQQLLERFLACRPTGEARANRVVIVALYPSVKESFQVYYELTESMGILIDRFMEMEVPDCVKVLDLFSRVAKQFDELDQFYAWCKNVGIARSSDYPEVEKITPKKLDLMDDFIRQKSNARVLLDPEQQQENDRDSNIRVVEEKEEDEKDEEAKEEEEEEEEEEQEQDLNSIKALPAPDEGCREKEGDLLGLGESDLSGEDRGEKLALLLFDGPPAVVAPPPQWEAFSDGAADWETALVESASGMAHQRTELGGGFDPLVLDGMYKGNAGLGLGLGFGSASSVVMGRPAAVLALPGPGGPMAGGDPFAASLGVAPPAYIQMSEMERKQRLMAEEQMMWQQYARDGMQGQLGMGRIQHGAPYNVGLGRGYTSTY